MLEYIEFKDKTKDIVKLTRKCRAFWGTVDRIMSYGFVIRFEYSLIGKNNAFSADHESRFLCVTPITTRLEGSGATRD